MRWIILAMMACTSGGDDGTGPGEDTGDTGTATKQVECATPSVTLGTGVFAFEALEEDQPLEMVYGPQGGWHFDTAAQVEGMGPNVQFKGIVTLERNGDVIAGEDDVPVSVDMATAGLGLWDAASCSGSFFGQVTYIDDVEVSDGVPLIQRMCALDAEDVTFTIEVTDPVSGTVVSDSVTVFARLDPSTPCP